LPCSGSVFQDSASVPCGFRDSPRSLREGRLRPGCCRSASGLDTPAATVVRGFSCFFDRGLLLLRAGGANAVGGRRIKLPFEELFEAHPSALETNVVAPG